MPPLKGPSSTWTRLGDEGRSPLLGATKADRRRLWRGDDEVSMEGEGGVKAGRGDGTKKRAEEDGKTKNGSNGALATPVVITRQPHSLRSTRSRKKSAVQSRAHWREREEDERKTVFCYSPKRLRKGQIDLFPRAWCGCLNHESETGQSFFYDDAKASSPPNHPWKRRSHNKQSDSDGDPVLHPSGLEAAGDLVWRVCFYLLCFPLCYPCYVSRTVRKREKAGLRTMEEELAGISRSSSLVDMFNKSSDEMNRTMLRQVSGTKTKTMPKRTSPQGGHNYNTVEDEEQKVISVNVILLHSASSHLLHKHLSTGLPGKATVATGSLLSLHSDNSGLLMSREPSREDLADAGGQDEIRHPATKQKEAAKSSEVYLTVPEERWTSSAARSHKKSFNFSAAVQGGAEVSAFNRHVSHGPMSPLEEQRGDAVSIVIEGEVTDRGEDEKGGKQPNGAVVKADAGDAGVSPPKPVRKRRLRKLKTLSIMKEEDDDAADVSEKPRSPTVVSSPSYEEYQDCRSTIVDDDSSSDEFQPAVSSVMAEMPREPAANYDRQQSSTALLPDSKTWLGRKLSFRRGSNTNGDAPPMGGGETRASTDHPTGEHDQQHESALSHKRPGFLRRLSARYHHRRRGRRRRHNSNSSSVASSTATDDSHSSFYTTDTSSSSDEELDEDFWEDFGGNSLWGRRRRRMQRGHRRRKGEEAKGGSKRRGRVFVRERVVQMENLGTRIEMVKDLGYQMSFSVFDEASVAEWKGDDLRLAKEMPNMDLIVLAVKKNHLTELNSVLASTSGVLHFVGKFWKGFYPLLLIELYDPQSDQEEVSEFSSRLTRLDSLFLHVHHIRVCQSQLDDSVDWITECLARLFIHSRIYQCQRFYGQGLSELDRCPGGCGLSKTRKRTSQHRMERKRVKWKRKQSVYVRAKTIEQ